MKLAIVSTHPIQYNAPWFRLLAAEPDLDVHVFYTWGQSQSAAKYDPGFGKVIEWDIPLLDGYNHSFVNNVATQPGSHHFKGIITPTLTKEIEQWKADTVLVVGWPFKSHLQCMKYFKGKIPVLFRGDSTLLDEKPGVKQILRRLMLRYVYAHVDIAFYVGTNNKDYFLAHGVKERQLWFAPHAIDNDRFAPGNPQYLTKANNWKKEAGIEEGDFVVLFAGKFNLKKDPFFMLSLAKELPNKNMKFVLVGNGELEKQLKAQNKDERVIFIDFKNQAEMPAVYAMCNVFVLPSKGPNETWGLAINEAIAAGKHVVTTDQVGCAVDLVVDNINGIVIKPGDVQSAARFIDRVCKTPDYSKMNETNQKILEVFSFGNIVKEISNCLHSLKNT